MESEGYATRTFIVPASAIGARHKRDRLWIIAHTDRQSEPTSTKHEQRLLAHTESGGRRRNGDIGKAQGRSQSNATQFDSFGAIPPRPNDVADTNDKGIWSRSGGPSSKLNEEDKRGVNYQKGSGRDAIFATTREPQNLQKVMADTDSERRCSWDTKRQDAGNVGEPSKSTRDNTRGVEERQSQPELGGMADGIPTRLDGFDGWDTEPEDIPRVVTGMTGRATRLKGLGNAIVPQIAMNIGLAIKEQLQ